MPKYAIAYWLLPAKPARSFFAQTIRQLALDFGDPEFAPHLTLAVVPVNSRAPEQVLLKIGSSDVTLTIREIRYTQKFTKSLFVQFETSDQLDELTNAIERASGVARKSIIEPHLSLLYHDLAAEEKRDVASRIRIPFRNVRFDAICAMRCASPTRSAADVRQWKLVATQNSTMR